MEATQTLSDGKGTIHLEGDLTLPSAAELRSLFIKSLVNADRLTITFGKVESIDLSFLQLLCSLHRSAVRLQKQVCFDGALPRTLTETADAGGFSRLRGCKLDSQNSCLWITVAGGHHG